MSDRSAAAVGRWLCLVGATLGALGLVGWTTGATFLTTIVPGQPPMMPNTSVALVLIGVAGALRSQEDAGRVRRIVSLVAALLVLAIGAATLMQYLLQTDLGIDELVIRSEAGPYPGRMSPPTALAFSCLASALLFFDFRPTARARPSEWLILCAGLVALTALTGMLLGAPWLYRLSGTSVVGVALPTAISLLLTSFGLLLERPNAGVMRVFAARGPGGVLLRRLVLPTILGPVLLAVVVTRVFAALWIGDFPLAIAVLVIATTVIGLTLLAITAVPLNRADAALRASEAKFSGVISLAADAIISVDKEQRITLFNEAAERIFGYSNAEVIGVPFDILIPLRFRAVHRQHVEKFAAGRDVSRQMDERGGRTILALRKNGEEFRADAAISKLDVDGERILTIVLRDVTEQKRIEREQRFLAKIGEIFASSLDPSETVRRVTTAAVEFMADFVILDLVEQTTLRRAKVAHADPRKADVARALESLPPDQHQPPVLRAAIETRQTQVLTVTDEAHRSELPDVRARALVEAMEPRSVMFVPLIARDDVVGVMTFVSSTPGRNYGASDVRLADEVARRAALALENSRLYRMARDAIGARDEILGIVAHDLRNPLNSVVVQASLLRRHGGEPERRARKPADAIERAANRMNRLIQDLLDVTRMEAGRLSIEQHRVHTAQVVTDALEAQRAMASTASLELQVDLAPDPPEVWADRERLLQVLENLIGNALKFTDPGGRIMVGAAPRDGEVLFWVADTGSGIAAEDLPHVFDRFWQVGKAERRGAGLGLPIVKGIIEAHCGRIWVESKPGQGSTFFFTIPTAARPTRASHVPALEVGTR